MMEVRHREATHHVAKLLEDHGALALFIEFLQWMERRPQLGHRRTRCKWDPSVVPASQGIGIMRLFQAARKVCTAPESLAGITELTQVVPATWTLWPESL